METTKSLNSAWEGIRHPVIVQLPIAVYEQMQEELKVSKREHLEERIRTYGSVIKILEVARGSDVDATLSQAIVGLTVALKYAQGELDRPNKEG